MSFREQLKALERHADELMPIRNVNSLANDVFEAVDDLRHLSRRFADGDTRIDYPARAKEELSRWKELDMRLQPSAEVAEQFTSVYSVVQQVLKHFLAATPPIGGHREFLRVVRDHFSFLSFEYGFRIVSEEPASITFSSADVYVELSYAKDTAGSFVFGWRSHPDQYFWLDDLLFLNGDERYRRLPEDLHLDGPADVDRWFSWLASVVRQYGRDVLTNRPGMFERLSEAQKQRDQEHARRLRDRQP